MLNQQESSLVCLGASIGSNCIPCVVYYLKQCRKSGLTDEQIRTAVDAAIKVKNVPAENILAAINRQMEEQWTPGQDDAREGCGCGC